MKNIKLITNSIRKFTNSIEKYCISKINLLSIYFDLKKYKQLNKRDKLTISSFNKYLIFLISLLFLYLFYLSIPSLYDKGRLQKDLSEKLLLEYKINISSSSKIIYSILPYPHILIENAKLFNNNLEKPMELGQIKKLKIFISQKNFFNQNNLRIKNIIINEANFSIQSNNIDFFSNYMEEQFSKKNLKVKKSKIFFRKNNGDIISIILIKNLDLFFNEKKFSNQIEINGEIFKLPFGIKWSKNFENKKYSKTFFKIKQLLLEIQNTRFLKNDGYVSSNKINIRNLKLLSQIEIKENSIHFKSKNFTNKKNKFNYEGQIDLEPFDLKLNINLKEINHQRIAYINSFFEELLNTGLIFNNNLNSKISLKADKFTKNKLFDSVKLYLNINNGRLNLNDSILISDKIGYVIFNDSEIKQVDGEILFTGNFNFIIKNQYAFYKAFQIPKSERMQLNKINFTLEYNMFRDEFKFLNFTINKDKKNSNTHVEAILNNFNNDKKNKIDNWIDLKIFVNQLIEAST